jgi:hypothetical protein
VRPQQKCRSDSQRPQAAAAAAAAAAPTAAWLPQMRRMLLVRGGALKSLPAQTEHQKIMCTHSAVVVVAGTLAVELAGAEVDVGGSVAVHPGLGDGSGGAGISGVESDRLSEALCEQQHKNRYSPSFSTRNICSSQQPCSRQLVQRHSLPWGAHNHTGSGRVSRNMLNNGNRIDRPKKIYQAPKKKQASLLRRGLLVGFDPRTWRQIFSDLLPSCFFEDAGLCGDRDSVQIQATLTLYPLCHPWRQTVT